MAEQRVDGADGQFDDRLTVELAALRATLLEAIEQTRDRLDAVDLDVSKRFEDFGADFDQVNNRLGLLEARGLTDRQAWRAVGRLVLDVTPKLDKRDRG